MARNEDSQDNLNGETSPDGKAPREKETILLAEDEDEIRTLIKIVLEEQGYAVIEAKDGNDAIRKFSSFASSIDLLILDVVMPGKNGVHVHTAAKTIIPGIKAIFISGYVADTVCRQYLMGEKMHFLDKPINPSVLLAKVQEVLAACPDTGDIPVPPL
jgi:two-component system, cell cycle sensor histidine kinase and response regulator CckA